MIYITVAYCKTYISECIVSPGEAFITAILQLGWRELMVIVHSHNNSSMIKKISPVAPRECFVPWNSTISRDVEVWIIRQCLAQCACKISLCETKHSNQTTRHSHKCLNNNSNFESRHSTTCTNRKPVIFKGNELCLVWNLSHAWCCILECMVLAYEGARARVAKYCEKLSKFH